MTATPKRKRRASKTAWQPGPGSSTLLASASHELRAPIHTIIGMCELLARTSLTPAQAQYLEALRRAATTLTGVLENVLDSGSTVTTSMERIWLPDVVEAVIATVRDRAAAGNIGLDVIVGPEVPRRLRGDPLRLQMILINLMSNAVKYTPNGRVTLRIEPEHRGSSDELLLTFSVEDTGPGIPKESRDEIFLPHFRLPVHAHLEGVGLGLSITKRLVDELGGAIELKSRTTASRQNGGTGTSFRVTLPFLKSVSDEAIASTVHNMTIGVVGGAALTTALQTTLAPWNPDFRPLTLEAIGPKALSSLGDVPVFIVDETALEAAGSLPAARVIAVLSPGSFSRNADRIERWEVTPLFLPVTAGALVNALQRFGPDGGGAKHSAQVDLRGAVIHAADDDDDARALLRASLAGTGARLSVYGSIADLVAGVSSDPATTLILCDVEMPDGGARVALAALPSRSTLNFVAMTAHRSPTAIQLRGEGFTDVVRKPFLGSDLIDVVARFGVPRLPESPPQNVLRTEGPDRSLSDDLQLEARMALASRDYRALEVVAQRFPENVRDKLREAALAKDDAALRDILRTVDQGSATGVDDLDDAIKKLLPGYLMSRGADVDAMRTCVARGDHHQLGQIAHRIAGTAAPFGLPELGDLARQIEVAPPGASTTPALIERLARTVDDARRALTAKVIAPAPPK
jgi:nitrogen-specific signal transduction histidine kinase/CheY-like chemotaxis protein